MVSFFRLRPRCELGGEGTVEPSWRISLGRGGEKYGEARIVGYRIHGGELLMKVSERERACRALASSLPGMSSLALPSYLRRAGSGQALLESILRGSADPWYLPADRIEGWREFLSEKEPLDYLGELAEKGIRVLVPGDEEYPSPLGEIFDPPPVLFVRGRTLPPPGERPYVGVVGSRKCSDYGRETAVVLSRSLGAKGAVIVSGAAYGIDGWAHRGCMEAGGFTVAVLGCGVDIPYPALHRELLEEISERGAVISEYPPGTEPAPWRFPHRNRIIAGLSHFLLVVEAAERSGALITARLALEEGREVGAVPGPVNSPLSAGTNALIRWGAKLVAREEDVWEELPMHLQLGCLAGPGSGAGEEVPARHGVPAACLGSGGGGRAGSWQAEKGKYGGIFPLEDIPRESCDSRAGLRAEPSDGEEDFPGEVEKKILEKLTSGPKVLDQLVIELGISAGELLGCLTGLKVAGRVTELAGGRYSLALPQGYGVDDHNEA